MDVRIRWARNHVIARAGPIGDTRAMPRTRPSLLLIAALAIGGCSISPSWRPEDSAAVSDALARYRSAWLAGDPDSVMAHVRPDVVLYVPGPAGTLRGDSTVRAYWFPPSGDTTYPIHVYEIRDERVTGAGDLAVVEGRSRLGWSMMVAGVAVRGDTSESEFLTVMRRDDGRWRIARNMFVARP